MSNETRLRLVVRTPHASVINREVESVRLPTETGQVGLRARREPIVIAVEPGLILLHESSGNSFASSAGGLMQVADNRAVLFTPYAVAGHSPEEVLEQLDKAMAAPDSELSMRRKLSELERHILQELARKSGKHGTRAFEANA
jgi:F0F1-type ATP synthase epsilon subunit